MEVNATDPRVEDAAAAAIVLNVAITVVSTIGILINGYILIIIVMTKQPVSASSILLVHLGTVGVLASGVSLCGGGGACTCSALVHALHPLQLWTVCGMHADRAAAIVAPLHYAAVVSAKKVMISAFCSWMATAALLTPLAVAQPPLVYNVGLGSCAPDCGAGFSALGFCLVYELLTLLLPIILVLICSLKILRIARYHRHRIAAAIFEVTLSAQVTVTHQRNPFTAPTPPRRRALSSVLQPLGSLAVFYCPYYCILIWPVFATPPQLLSALSAVLIAAAPSANGILYGIGSHALKESLRNYRRKQVTKSEVTQEIQARTPSTCGSRQPSLSASLGCIRPLMSRRLSDVEIESSKVSDSLTQRTASCHVLQDCAKDESRSKMSAIPIIRASSHVILSRALGLDQGVTRDRYRWRSPQITVTRATSDNSDSLTNIPLCHQQSRSSGALLDPLLGSRFSSDNVHRCHLAEHQHLLKQDVL